MNKLICIVVCLYILSIAVFLSLGVVTEDVKSYTPMCVVSTIVLLAFFIISVVIDDFDL